MKHRHPPRQQHSRRRFLRQISIGSALMCGLSSEESGLLKAQRSPSYKYDLVVKGGRLVDPSQEISENRDIAISDGKVALLARNIPESDALHVLQAKGKIVTPGLIDMHVHVYDGVAPLSIPCDPNHIAKGVTTVVDAGSAGANTFPGFRKYVINQADTRVKAMLNISVVGQSTLSRDNVWGELIELRYVNPKLTAATIEKHRDVIMGVKVRLTENITGPHDLQALGMAREAADAVKLPLMVHIGASYSPVKDIMGMLKKGDVLTHCFRDKDGGIIDDNGRILQSVHQAIARGVHLDVGHGAGSFSFDTAELALEQDVLPGTISSDVHQWNVNGPVFDLATTLSKFMQLGLTLEQVIERATKNPSMIHGQLNGLGTLKVGAEADVAVFDLAEGDFVFRDAQGATRIGRQLLRPVATVKGGHLYGMASIPVTRL